MRQHIFDGIQTLLHCLATARHVDNQRLVLCDARSVPTQTRKRSVLQSILHHSVHQSRTLLLNQLLAHFRRIIPCSKASASGGDDQMTRRRLIPLLEHLLDFVRVITDNLRLYLVHIVLTKHTLLQSIHQQRSTLVFVHSFGCSITHRQHTEMNLHAHRLLLVLRMLMMRVLSAAITAHCMFMLVLLQIVCVQFRRHIGYQIANHQCFHHRSFRQNSVFLRNSQQTIRRFTAQQTTASLRASVISNESFL
mmetsp:Transcript_46164/g.74005  ORF Transcript_46164/g.74005 Transcript_46164/m.74005 type:complete len:250 (-) Transcript_46164:1303-2052(-)